MKVRKTTIKPKYPLWQVNPFVNEKKDLLLDIAVTSKTESGILIHSRTVWKLDRVSFTKWLSK